MITVDLGWGGTSSSPTNQVLALQILDGNPAYELQNDAQKGQDAVYAQVETPMTISWRITFFRDAFPDDGTARTALKNILKFFQAQPKFIRLSTDWWTTIHSTSWIQVYMKDKEFAWEKKGDGVAGKWAFSFTVYEGAPTDAEGL